jgi:hypothetical protein
MVVRGLMSGVNTPRGSSVIVMRERFWSFTTQLHCESPRILASSEPTWTFVV